jgi:hypothetical protein
MYIDDIELTGVSLTSLVADSVEEDAIMKVIEAKRWDLYAKLQSGEGLACEAISNFAFTKALVELGELDEEKTNRAIPVEQFKKLFPKVGISDTWTLKSVKDREGWRFIGADTLVSAEADDIALSAYRSKDTHRVMIVTMSNRIDAAKERLARLFKANTAMLEVERHYDAYDPDVNIEPAEDRVDDWEPSGETHDSGNWDVCLGIPEFSSF